MFSLAGIDGTYSGRSYVVRLDRDSHWIVPLQVPLSAAQVREHVVFISREAALEKAAGKEESPSCSTTDSRSWTARTVA